MTTASIAEIYDTIKNCNGEYCSICFRPADQRRLVNPVFLIQLRSSLLKFLPLDASKDKEVKVCYLCEAMAARTLRFQQVVTLAASVEALLTWMTAEFRDALDPDPMYPPTKVTREMNRMVIRTRELEAALKDTVVPQLANSNVLHVGSEPQVPIAGPSIGTAVTAPTTRPVYPSINPNTTGTTPHITKDPPNRQGSKGPGAPGLATGISVPGNLQLQVKERANGNVVLHPIVIGSNQKMYVPSLKVEVVNNETLRSVSDMDLFQYANIPIPATPDVRNNIANKISTAGIFYDVIRQQTEDKQANKSAEDPLEILSTDDDDTSNEKVQATVDQNCVNNGSLDAASKCQLASRIEQRTKKRKRKVGLGYVRGVLKPVRTYAVNSATKRPVMQMDKVLDWEDKIPMDVISFMDATDPNPNERIMQPNIPIPPPSPTMGLISNVRTIKENEHNGNVINGNENNGNENNSNENNSIENNSNENNVNTVMNDEDVDNDVMLIENIECIDLC